MMNFDKFDTFVLISDIHLGAHSDSLEWVTNIKNYFYEFFIPKIKELAVSSNVAIIIAGDIFDNRHRIDINVMNTAREIFTNILNINDDIEIFCIPGNHDLYKVGKTSDNITSLTCLSMNRFNIIDDVTNLKTKNGLNVLFVPWVGDVKLENEIIKSSNDDIIIMHTEIAGANYDNGQKIINGVNLTLSNAKKIYSGHIHKRQELKKCTYIGCPYQLSRGDSGNIKGLYIITLLDNKMFNETFIENDYSPKFIKLKANELINENIDLYTNHYVDIVVSDTELKDTKISKFVNSIKDKNFRRAEIILEKQEIKSDISTNINTNISVTDVINDYISNLSDISKIDKKQLLKLNSKYITMCNE